ncbi:hypothetical protein T10_366 [Trichinella papuae]|uniref:Uncharacterized protein n=1 Tax=Trichinella papuae TaxID=268474 RepID=A0A0V1N9N0_9BILA|nr:hypothetical protein T10_366 [Trichinella papuae]
MKRPPFVLPTDGSIPPIQMRAQRVPFALRISEELDLLIDQNILELVQSTHRPRRLCLSSNMMRRHISNHWSLKRQQSFKQQSILELTYFGPHLTRTGRFQFGASERVMISVVPSLVSTSSSVSPPFEDLTSLKISKINVLCKTYKTNTCTSVKFTAENEYLVIKCDSKYNILKLSFSPKR